MHLLVVLKKIEQRSGRLPHVDGAEWHIYGDIKVYLGFKAAEYWKITLRDPTLYLQYLKALLCCFE